MALVGQRTVVVTLIVIVAMQTLAWVPLVRSRAALMAYREEACREVPFGSPRIVMVGDSLTMGGEPWERHLRVPPCAVTAMGHIGYTIAELRPYAEQAVAARPKVIALTAGTNDILLRHDLPTAAAQFVALVDMLKARAKLIVTLPPPTADFEQTRRIHQLHRLLLPALAARNVPVVKLDALETGGQLAKPYSSDGVHLTGAAYAIWGRKLRAVL